MKRLHIPKTFCFTIAVVITLASGGPPGAWVFAQNCPDTVAGIQSRADCEFCITDLNQDGYVTVQDAMILKKCLAARCTQAEYDVNGDGSVNENDYEILLSCMKNGCVK